MRLRIVKKEPTTSEILVSLAFFGVAAIVVGSLIHFEYYGLATGFFTFLLFLERQAL